MVLRSQKRFEASGGWRKLCNEDLPSVISMNKTWRMAWAVHEALMEEVGYIKPFVGNLKGHLRDDLRVDGDDNIRIDLTR